MELLLWFQSIRTPILTDILSVITNFGAESICLGIICFLFWCVDKKSAYKLGFSFYFSSLVVQSLKITFRVQRPWVLNSKIKPVESAVPNATGFSFPSGHTQIATSLYSTGFWCFKKNIYKILCGFMIFAVAVSRMYLGVHTPMDVGISFLISIIIAVIIFSNFEKLYAKENILKLSVIFGVLSVAVAIFAYIMHKNNFVPFAEARDCFKASGAGVGFALGYYFERKHINYNEKYGTVLFHTVKFVLGITVLYTLRTCLKALFPQNLFCDMIRYFIIAIYALSIYPFLINKYIEKKQKNK